MPAAEGDWGKLFGAAFAQSRNAMALLDGDRRIVDVNGAFLALLGYQRRQMLGRPMWEFVVGGPAVNAREWRSTLARGRFTGESHVRCADASEVHVQWAGTSEVVTGRRLVLFVALSTSRWGRAFRRPQTDAPTLGTRQPLTPRELEIVRLVALGSTAREIAEELQITHDTVRTHARNAMLKTGARSRAQLVAKAMGDGLILAKSA